MMASQWSATFPARVCAGEGSVRELTSLARGVCRVTLMTDKLLRDKGVSRPVEQALRDAGVEPRVVCCPAAEPDSEQVLAMLQTLREAPPELLVAVGGGSVLDMAKLQAVLLANPALAENLRDVSRIVRPGVPTVLLPTTTGTGAEATQNSVILFRAEDIKCGILHEALLAKAVILDPALVASLPASLVASSGVDALCHAVESYISKRRTPLSACLSLEAARLIAENIETACFGEGAARRTALLAMQVAAYEAGLCLNSSCTVAAHALSYPIGGKYHVPHGVANAILLAAVMRASLDCCTEAFATLYRAMWPAHPTLPDAEAALAFVDALDALVRRLGIPADYSGYGMTAADIPYLTENALAVHRLIDNHPKPLSREDVEAIYRHTLA